MKIAWLSAPAHAKTGYGIITNFIVSMLTDQGFDIINIGGGTTAVWGGKFFIATEGGNSFPVLPSWGRIGGRDVLPTYIEHYKFDLIITLWDCFAVNYAKYINLPMINYLPVDASFTRKMYDDVKHAYRLVTYSKFGYRQLLKWFAPTRTSYIPHGIDTTLWQPISDEDRKEVRELINVPEHAYLFIHVGANVGERKHIPQLMLTFKKFLEEHEAYLYIYGNVQSAFPEGYDLISYANELGILDHLRYQKLNTILVPLETEGMALLYGAADAYITASMGEGFGIPLLESMACGTPCIAPRNSAQTELVKGHGWLAKNIPEDQWVDVPVWIPTLQAYPVVDMQSLLECMNNACDNRGKYRAECREFALEYDWKKIIPQWVTFLNHVEEELELLNEIK